MKFAVTFGFLVVLISLFFTWKSSRHLHLHRNWANLSFWMTLLAVVVTEIMVRLNGGVQLNSLFLVHLGSAVAFFCALLTLRFWMTGLRQRNYHRIGGYLCLALYVVTFATGMTLLWM